ncbi:MAG: hypothetical protein QM661_14425 [Solimonas sp.]
MRWLRLLVLCLVTALLPFDGIARVAVPVCAAHRAASTQLAFTHEHHAGMAMMDMQMEADADPQAMHDERSAPAHTTTHDATTHDDCRCASLCAAHCASTTAAAVNPLATLDVARSEAPAASDGRDPRPARRLDLLRPPANARA